MRREEGREANPTSSLAAFALAATEIPSDPSEQRNRATIGPGEKVQSTFRTARPSPFRTPFQARDGDSTGTPHQASVCHMGCTEWTARDMKPSGVVGESWSLRWR